MGHLTYAAILGLALACAGWLQALPGVHVLDRPKRLLGALVPSVVFVAWDVVATESTWWRFAPEYTLGARLFGLPLEEIAFFVVIPVCAVLTLEAVRVLYALVFARVRT